MKIGLFTDTYIPQINGVSTSLNMLKTSLEKMGHNVYIVTSNPESFIKYEWDKKNKILKVPGVKLGIYDYRYTSIYPLRKKKLVKSWNLDIIHSHQDFGIGNMAIILSKEFKIPLVHTLHTDYGEQLHHLNKLERPLKKFLKGFHQFYCDKNCDELIVPTPKTAQTLKNKYDINRKINIIPSGIDHNLFLREKQDEKELEKIKEKYNIKKKDFVLISVGRIAKEKRFGYLIECMPKIISKNKNIKLIIAGEGPDKEKLLNLTKKLKVEENIIFTGKIAWEDMPKYYNISNILLTASKSETQGLTVIEAMAANVVPVCIKDKAFLTMIDDNKDGLIFKNKNELIEKVLELSENKKILKKLIENNKEKVIKYSSDKYAEKLIKLYKELISKGENNVNNIE